MRSGEPPRQHGPTLRIFLFIFYVKYCAHPPTVDLHVAPHCVPYPTLPMLFYASFSKILVVKSFALRNSSYEFPKLTLKATQLPTPCVSFGLTCLAGFRMYIFLSRCYRFKELLVNLRHSQEKPSGKPC